MFNAIEAMPEGGSLNIITGLYSPAEGEAEGGFVEVKIQDTGYGISQENLAKIFEPFFTTKEGRPGLGLPTARRTIESHKGTIEAESKPKEGTTLTIHLPVSE